MGGTAPFHPDPHRDGGGGGLVDGRALWRRAQDGLRLRLGLWPGDPTGMRGTVLLFPGRTEYLEKYCVTATALAGRGLAMLAIDWRGQGLTDRLLADRNIGHVEHFGDYQHDVAAMVATAERLALPRPWYLLAHSMGGAIGLRALHEGLAVRAACFTAPMWGIAMNPLVRLLARVLSAPRHLGGLGHFYAPGTGPASYVAATEFEGNLLTSDPGMYQMLQRQIRDHPDLSLGGPSLTWLGEALAEARALARLPAPDLPALTLLGGNERIIDTNAVRRIMAGWPRGALHEFPGAEHEILMETPALRAEAIDRTMTFFDRAAQP
jgi:lysophospholipase